VEVELVVGHAAGATGGVSRYASELEASLGRRIRFRRVTPRPWSQRLPLLRSLPKRLDGHRPGTLVHFTQIVGSALMLWRPVRPAVATVHDLGGLEWPNEWRSLGPIGRALLRLSFQGVRRMDTVICVSEATRASVIEKLGVAPERARRVYSGVDLDRFRPRTVTKREEIERLGVPYEERIGYILFVGSEAPRKNLEVIFGALSHLAASGQRVRLLKVGGAGSDTARHRTVELIQRHGVAHLVSLLGAVSDAQLSLLYNCADVVVCPSHVEGFNFPLVEALACGTPVVASDIPVHREIGAGAAYFEPPNDAEAFAGAIEESLRMGREASRTQVGLRRAEELTWSVAADLTEQIYRKLIRD
jgi:glycosyltransferase involved in cell wall biosynthesis